MQIESVPVKYKCLISFPLYISLQNWFIIMFLVFSFKHLNHSICINFQDYIYNFLCSKFFKRHASFHLWLERPDLFQVYLLNYFRRKCFYIWQWSIKNWRFEVWFNNTLKSNTIRRKKLARIVSGRKKRNIIERKAQILFLD